MGRTRKDTPPERVGKGSAPEPEHPPNPQAEVETDPASGRDLLGFRPSHRVGLSRARLAAGGRMRRYLARVGDPDERPEEES